MRIPVNIGKGQTIYLQSGENSFELAERREVKVKKDGIETGEVKEEFIAFNWFSNLDGALKKVLKYKVMNSDATTLAELVLAIDAARKEITAVYGPNICTV